MLKRSAHIKCVSLNALYQLLSAPLSRGAPCGREWRSRYFHLHHRRISYFESEEDAVPVALAMSVACGALYPWNAKFGYLSPGLPTKYPMHYVPEVLMAVLSCLGIAAMM